MLVFNSLHDVMLDAILDLDDLTDIERTSLISSISGVAFQFFTPDLKAAFRTAVLKFLNKHHTIKTFYERG